MNAAWTVRRASLADLQVLIAIERDCPDAAHWSEAVWRATLQPPDTDTSARAVWLAEAHGAPAGCVVVQCVGRDAELENLAVRPENRRQGVARALCQQAVQWAVQWATARAAARREAPITEAVVMRADLAMRLEVRAANAPALQLYAALGFIEQGRRTRYYQDPVDDAVLMARPLDGPA